MADAVGFHEIAGPGTPARRPDTLWWLAAVTLAVVLAVPFFLVDVPPVLDYPNHLARYFVLAHPDDPYLSQIYQPQWRLVPNTGMDALGAVLLKLTSVHVGGRMLLALSLFAPVIGVIAYHRVAFGRFEYWPLASGLIAYNGIFFLGFMNFLLSLGLALVGAACWMAQRRGGGRWGAVAVGGVAGALIFLGHLFGVIMFALLIGAQEWARLWSQRRSGDFVPQLAVTVGLLALTLAPAVLLYLAGPLSEGAAAPGAWLGFRKIWTSFTPFMTTNVWLTVWTATGVAAVLLLCWRHAVLAPGIWLAMLLLALLFLAAPTSIKGASFVDVRLPLMIALLLFGGLQPNFQRREAMVAAVIVTGLLVIRTGYISSDWIAHRRDLADLRRAIAPLPPLSRVLVASSVVGTALYDEVPSRLLPGMYRLDRHLGALVAIERHGFWPLMFADPTQQPVEVKPPYRALSQPLGEPVLLSALGAETYTERMLFDSRYLPGWRSGFDYVLLILPNSEQPLPPGVVPVVSTDFANMYRIQPPL